MSIRRINGQAVAPAPNTKSADFHTLVFITENWSNKRLRDAAKKAVKDGKNGAALEIIAVMDLRSKSKPAAKAAPVFGETEVLIKYRMEEHRALETIRRRWMKSGNIPDICVWIMRLALMNPETITKWFKGLCNYCEAEALDQTLYMTAAIRTHRFYRGTKPKRG